MPNNSPALSKTESELFAIINHTFEESQTARWQALIHLRDTRQLSEEQQSELIELGNEIESMNVKRFEAIGELAKLRGVEFSALCQKLQILPS